MITLHEGDCLDLLRDLPEKSIDAVVTDPPYGLSDHSPKDVATCIRAWLRGETYRPNKRGFAGERWDAWVPGPEVWREVFRVLKPGGHLLAFAGTRSMDLMSMAVRMGGLELRDNLGFVHDNGGAPLMAWVYSSGPPKGADLSKAIDRQILSIPVFDAIRAHIREWRDKAGFTNVQINEAMGFATSGAGMARHWTSEVGSQHAIPSKEQWRRLKAVLGWPDCEFDAIYDRVKDGAERPVIGWVGNPDDAGEAKGMFGFKSSYAITASASPEAKQWEGWNTTLRPAWEPIIMARRPLEGTVGENVARHGTGGINIDACRVEAEARPQVTRYKDPALDLTRKVYGGGLGGTRWDGTMTTEGRWPANVIHDGSDEVEEAFALYGETKDGFSGMSLAPTKIGPTGLKPRHEAWGGYGGSGTAARFFFCAKANRAERGDSGHPTVKPVALMRYLVQLVTPPEGVVLDPFAGTGTTGQAAKELGVAAVLMEREPDYAAHIRKRLGL